jgi:hypothetical protein
MAELGGRSNGGTPPTMTDILSSLRAAFQPVQPLSRLQAPHRLSARNTAQESQAFKGLSGNWLSARSEPERLRKGDGGLGKH